MKRIILALGFSFVCATSFAQENTDIEPLQASNPNAFYNRIDFSAGLIFEDRWGGFEIEAWEFYLNGDLALGDHFRARFSLPFSNYTPNLFEGTSIDFDYKLSLGNGMFKSVVLSAGLTSPLGRDMAFFNDVDNYGIDYELRTSLQAELQVNDQISLYPYVGIYRKNGINRTTRVFGNGDSTYTYPSLFRPGVRTGITASYDFTEGQFIQLRTDFDFSHLEYRGGDFDESVNIENDFVNWTVNLRYQYAFNRHSQMYVNLKYNQEIMAYESLGVRRDRMLHFAIGYNYLID